MLSHRIAVARAFTINWKLCVTVEHSHVHIPSMAIQTDCWRRWRHKCQLFKRIRMARMEPKTTYHTHSHSYILLPLFSITSLHHAQSTETFLGYIWKILDPISVLFKCHTEKYAYRMTTTRRKEKRKWKRNNIHTTCVSWIVPASFIYEMRSVFFFHASARACTNGPYHVPCTFWPFTTFCTCLQITKQMKIHFKAPVYPILLYGGTQILSTKIAHTQTQMLTHGYTQ